MTTTDTHAVLLAAGWKLAPDGRWTSPLTRHAFDELAALSLARLMPLTRDSRRANRRHRFARR
jgi:hypothetical protein